MTTTELLQNQYNRDDWKSFLTETIGENYITFRKDVIKEELSAVAKSLAHQITRYGTVTTSDGNELPVFEVIIQERIILERNRVGLNSLIRNNIIQKGREGALVTFAYPKETGKKEWRFTFIAHSESVFGDENDLKTNPKRYTYVFGTPEKHRTAKRRFEILQSSRKSITDFINAFDVEPLSKKFFSEYRDQYSAFIEYLTGENKNGKIVNNPSTNFTTVFSENKVRARDFVKKMLGRIIFLYFLQRKGWMGVRLDKKWGEGQADFIHQLFLKSGADENFYYTILEKLFFEVLNAKRDNDEVEFNGEVTRIPYLNGGLFEKEVYMKGKVLTFPPHLFANLFNFLEEYNFTIHENSPEDHIVAVDPEMLGNIFENLLEDNKEKGAFYTPKEIVHYMCQESLIEYLTTHLSQEFKLYRKLGNHQIELFGNDVVRGQLSMLEEFGEKALNRKDVEIIVKDKNILNLSKEQLKRIDELLDAVKICDPAIGSGAFPMGLLLEIFAIKELIAFDLKIDRSPVDVKENIIQNSIYGVDIEPGAVDIARLRFWLSLVVDEDEPKPLPNLDYKIVVGDSLLSKFEGEVLEINWKILNIGTGTKFAKAIKSKLKNLVQKQKEYFDSKGQKENLKHEIRQLKIEILENQIKFNQIKFKDSNRQSQMNLFKKVQKSKKSKVVIQNFGLLLSKLEKLKNNDLLPFHHFDWKLNFPEIMNEQVCENMGFDIVIGNPPYIQLQKDSGYLAELYKNCGYETYTRMGDIYALFYEKGFQILKENGVHTFITSNKWMRANYGKSLRLFLAKQNPIILIDLGSGVFENATVDTNILITKRGENKNHLKGFTVKNKKEVLNLSNLEFIFMKNLNEDIWIVLNPIELKLKSHIEKIGTPLKDWDIDINYGIKTGYNAAFIISKDKRDELVEKEPQNKFVFKKILRGRDIKKYTPEWNELYLVFIPWHFPLHDNKSIQGVSHQAEEEFKTSFPILYSYLESHKVKLSKRNKAETGKRYEWYALQRCAATYYDDFKKPKIIILI